MPFEVDQFVEACRAVRHLPDAPARIAALIEQAIADPNSIEAAIDARQAGLSPRPMADVFVNEDDLTIYHVACPPHVFGAPHDHAGWAVIGVYAGTESFNVYEETQTRLRWIRRDVLKAPAVRILPADLIHDIENAELETSGSIHVYSNRHFGVPERRIWRDTQSASEPFTLQKAVEFGTELTRRRRTELGISDTSMPVVPELE